MRAQHYIQACYVVPDIEAAIREYVRVTGIGPWIVMANVTPENGLYRGRPMHLEMSCAFAQSGPLQIEFIQQHNDGPSVYRDMIPANESGFHHFCYLADSLQAEIDHFDSVGVETGYQGENGPVKFAYFDTRAQLGAFTEVLQNCDMLDELFKMIADVAVDWDGKDPIRYL
jgi:methylmalonyl-CoA/ethylmalonyl-CoA epimerase